MEKRVLGSELLANVLVGLLDFVDDVGFIERGHERVGHTVVGDLMAFGGVATEFVPGDRIAPVSRRPSRRRSIRGTGLAKLRERRIHSTSRFGVVALAKRPAQTLRTEVAQLGHTLNGLQVVQQRYPLQRFCWFVGV